MGKRLGSDAAAERAGVKPGTWRGYVTRRQAPQPDGVDEDFGKVYWLEETVDNWRNNRPGPGARTDLQRKADAND